MNRTYRGHVEGSRQRRGWGLCDECGWSCPVRLFTAPDHAWTAELLDDGRVLALGRPDGPGRRWVIGCPACSQPASADVWDLRDYPVPLAGYVLMPQ